MIIFQRESPLLETLTAKASKLSVVCPWCPPSSVIACPLILLIYQLLPYQLIPNLIIRRIQCSILFLYLLPFSLTVHVWSNLRKFLDKENYTIPGYTDPEINNLVYIKSKKIIYRKSINKYIYCCRFHNYIMVGISHLDLLLLTLSMSFKHIIHAQKSQNMRQNKKKLYKLCLYAVLLSLTLFIFISLINKQYSEWYINKKTRVVSFNLCAFVWF